MNEIEKESRIRTIVIHQVVQSAERIGHDFLIGLRLRFTHKLAYQWQNRTAAEDFALGF